MCGSALSSPARDDSVCGSDSDSLAFAQLAFAQLAFAFDMALAAAWRRTSLSTSAIDLRARQSKIASTVGTPTGYTKSIATA